MITSLLHVEAPPGELPYTLTQAQSIRFYRLKPTCPLLLCCRRREHRVDRSYHLLHTLRKFLHVLVRCGIRS
jgi:hypothetical protein